MYLLRLIFALIMCDFSHSARILGFFPFFSNSHINAVLPVVEELARRGHNVTVVSYRPRTAPLANYTDIALNKYTENQFDCLTIDFFESHPLTALSNIKLLYTILPHYDNILAIPEVTDLLKQQFDVVVTELFNTDIFFGFFHKLNTPVVGISTCELFFWQHNMLGVPAENSYVPNTLSNHPYPMNLWHRIVNTVENWASIVAYHYLFSLRSQQLAEKYLGPLPPLRELFGNISLVLVNTHFSVLGVKPRNPNIIEIGGIHIKPPRTIPQDLKKLLDEAGNGVIFFSLGATLQYNGIKEDKKLAFLKVFKEMKITVLWKTDLNLTEENIYAMPWYPQRDVLAHPNVKLFISQCGLLSMTESLYGSVPMVCIPIFGDQYFNAKSLEHIGAGKMIEFTNLTEVSIRETITEVLTNPIYERNAKRITRLLNDRPLSPMDTATYWIEYVIRHKGAPHMKTIAKDLIWYQYYNFDVLLILALTVYLFILAINWLVKISLKLINNSYKTKLKQT